MKDSQITLSSKGLSRLSNAPSSNIINIIVGQTTYPVDSHLACYISPLISDLMLTDPLLDKFHFSNSEEQYFPLIFDLMYGRSVELTLDNVSFLIKAGQIFRNDELIQLCLKFINEPIKLSNVLSKIIRKYEMKLDYSFEIGFAASHLYEFDDDVLMDLNLDILKSLFGCRILQIRNESWLFSFVLTLIEKFGDDYRCLLRYVMYEALTDREMAEFINIIRLEDIDGIMWSALSNRLMKNVVNASGKSSRTSKCFTILSSETEEYPYRDNKSFDGIFANLSKKYGNLCEQGIVTVTSSGNISMPPKEIIDNNFTGYWYSTNVPNSWVMIDFGSLRIKPNAYSIRTGHFPPCAVEHIKSWVLEGSVDAQSWNELDRQKNTQDLNGDFKYKTYQCKQLEPYRYIRLRQITKNQHKSHFLFLNNIELFGTLIINTMKEEKSDNCDNPEEVTIHQNPKQNENLYEGEEKDEYYDTDDYV